MQYSSKIWIIVGLLGAILWIIDYYQLFKKPEITLSNKIIQKKINFFKHLFFIVGVSGWVLISFSLMGPRKASHFSEEEINANDIYFVVDVSLSMLADDFQPNRLEVSKTKIKQYISMIPKDRIGIIIFSDNIFTLLPLTTDMNLINKMVKEIKVGFLGGGTNIGDAIGLAVARLTKSLAKNKIIILLTDGVSNVGTMTPQQAAELAFAEKIKIYSIAVGGKKDARIPIGNGNNVRSFQTIPGGSYDVKTLNEISIRTGATSFVANNEKALSGVFKKINSLEKSKQKIKNRVLFKELFYNYLLLGVCLLVGVELSRKVLLREGL